MNARKKVFKRASMGVKEGVEPKQKAGDSTCCDWLIRSCMVMVRATVKRQPYVENVLPYITDVSTELTFLFNISWHSYESKPTWLGVSKDHCSLLYFAACSVVVNHGGWFPLLRDANIQGRKLVQVGNSLLHLGCVLSSWMRHWDNGIPQPILS